MEPVTKKDTSSAQNKQYKVGASCMQGWRKYMEDAHTKLLSLNTDKQSAFFAVFDGHGSNGHVASTFASLYLHECITRQSLYKNGWLEEAIKQGFLDLDEDMRNNKIIQKGPLLHGTTANCIIIKDNIIFCGNVGDSRSIASVHGQVQQLSFDHKPDNPLEKQRIVSAGGWVRNNRANGKLALSRALGDFIYKENKLMRPEEQIVTAYPDVTCHEITNGHEFIVLASDGIWEVMSNESVLKFVRTRIAQAIPPEIICEELLNQCLATEQNLIDNDDCGFDNMTMLLICFLNGQPYAKLCQKCQSAPMSSETVQLRHLSEASRTKRAVATVTKRLFASFSIGTLK